MIPIIVETDISTVIQHGRDTEYKGTADGQPHTTPWSADQPLTIERDGDGRPIEANLSAALVAAAGLLNNQTTVVRLALDVTDGGPHRRVRTASEMTASMASDAALDLSERAAMDDLLRAYSRIRGWGLRANTGELEQAVHVIQGFVIQHMLQRVAPEQWAAWFFAGGDLTNAD